MQYNGLLLVDKQPGCTSHDVVQQARRLLGQRKIGHCGTLDPAATGLLVLTLGKATRLTRFLINAPKVYSGTIRLGVSTDTYDATGEIVEERPVEDVTHQAVEARMLEFEGTSEQTTPAYSAKKVGGVKYYELARRGEEVPPASKTITVFEFRPIGQLEEGRIAFRLGCSSGTYVRSLAHELGLGLGCGGHLESLHRLQVGPFSSEDACTIDEIAAGHADGASPPPGWMDFDSIPLPFEEVRTDAQQERRIVHGQTVLIRSSTSEEGDWIKLVNRRRQLIAVGSVIERIGDGGVGVVQPRIVFH
jgi:tRNA pseudouridine55 synthase